MSAKVWIIIGNSSDGKVIYSGGRIKASDSWTSNPYSPMDCTVFHDEYRAKSIAGELAMIQRHKESDCCVGAIQVVLIAA